MSFASWFNNPSPSAAYTRQWIRSALVRMMACRLFAPGLYPGQCWVIVNWNRFQFVSCFNSSPLSAAYMRQWIGSALFRTMACRLLGARPLSGPVLGYCQLEQTSICILFLSSPPCVAYMREWIGSALVRMMACRLFAPGLCLGQCWVIVNWNRFQFVSCFNHLPLVPHICVSESVQHCFGLWLVAYSAPGLCPGQCWFTVNWNRLQFVFCFYHLLLVSHICVSESGQHCFGWWLIAYSRQAFIRASAGLL